VKIKTSAKAGEKFGKKHTRKTDTKGPENESKFKSNKHTM
jgi:hypothetical protein